MRTVETALAEFAQALKFPDYFGGNFNALFDCLTDLDWLPADHFLLIVQHAEQLLEEGGDGDLTALINVLEETCDYWQKTVPSEGTDMSKRLKFEVLYHATPDQEEHLTRRLAEYDMPRVELL
jgi:RNAse (barnase) inhibitor barstar